ncbi:MAG: M48 family peptidase [Deltaproteobacteria bacterium]|nr:MAG: M48 family peptidase [Deltaproteobacteria bacterium]
MHSLQVGDTTIPYEVRFSQNAGRKRIVVTPAGVEVVAPAGTPLEGADGIYAFVDRKRRWMFDASREVAEQHRKLLTQKYASGAKLQYRGRWLMLEVSSAEVAQVEIQCRSKFLVAVPTELEGVDKLEAIRQAFDGWLRERALRDTKRFGTRHEKSLGVQPAGYRLSEAKSRWGSLGRDGYVRVHWRLAQAPSAAMEYVVAHELAHLVHRNHSEEFWATLARTMPDWAERKAMLERWEAEHRAV